MEATGPRERRVDEDGPAPPHPACSRRIGPDDVGRAHLGVLALGPDRDKDVGVLVHDNGLGRLDDNDITANTFSGVAIVTGGNPTLRHNRIHRNGYQAVWVREGGGGVIEDNDLTDNPGGAWRIENGAGKLTRARNTEK